MKLQTQIPLQKQSENLIDYHSNVLLLGSCFVENIGEKFDYFQFKNLRNPFGILFHPKAIETFLSNVISKKSYSDTDIFFQNEQWHCFDAHSKLSHTRKDVLIETLNHQIVTTSQQIKEASHIIITLGTAWVYCHHESNLPVANCHKLPQKEFVKKLLSIEEIEKNLQRIYNQIRSVNPKISFIFTISPVRHLKDGFVENMRSKAHLISSIHQFLAKDNSLNCHYFPSYELMMDELRDYRFYADDMLHPNQLAVDYIWEKFKKVWISENSNDIMNDVDYVQKGMRHRPFNPFSEAHQKFMKDLERKKSSLQKKFSHISF